MKAMEQPDERDAHLRAALRHAPDAGVGAPTHVSAQIIAAAHRAAAERPVHMLPAAAARRWWRPGPARWGASGVLATVVMAGALTLLWQGTPPGPARERSAIDSPAAAPPAASASAPNVADAVVVAEAQPATSRLRQQLQAPALQQPALPRHASKVAAPLIDATPTPQAATASPLADAGQLPPAAAATAAPSDAAAPPAQRAAAPPVSMSKTGTDRMAAAAARPAPMAARATVNAADAPAPSLQAWLQMHSGTLQWQVDGAARVAADTGWLQGVALLTDGRWQPVAGQTPSMAGTALQLFAGEVPAAQLWLGPAQVLWCDGAARCSIAALSPGAASELLRTLPR